MPGLPLTRLAMAETCLFLAFIVSNPFIDDAETRSEALQLYQHTECSKAVTAFPSFPEKIDLGSVTYADSISMLASTSYEAARLSMPL